MKTRLACTSAFVLFAFAACSGETPIDTANAEAAPQADGEAILTKDETSTEPQVGDRIPEPEKDESSLAKAGAEFNSLAERGVTEIGWEELMPEGEEDRLAEMYQAQMAMLYSGAGVAEGSAGDQAVQIGTFNTVKAIGDVPADGMKIRLPGYTVPFEYGADAQITEFLLVPYYGACLHAPPPPPNQTVFVQTDEELRLKDLSQAVWIEGILRTKTQTSDLADAAYTIEMTGWEKYEY